MPIPTQAASRLALLAALLTGAAALPAQAAFLISSTGLSQPHQTLDFEGPTLVMNQAVTNEFQGFGVTFANAFGNPDPSPGYANISGNRIGNFQGGVGNQGTLVMDFSSPLSGVAFALVSASGTSTIQAFLNGTLVESASAATSAFDPVNFYGFTGIQLDRVTLSVVSFDRALMIDNLQIATAAPVPEPAGWALVGIALLALGAFSRPRAASVGPQDG